MATLRNDIGLSFDDVLLVPRKSTISSRFSGGIDLSTVIVPGLGLHYPIISANMDTTTGYELANTLSEAGALGIIHRFLPVESHLQELLNTMHQQHPAVLCIGVGKEQFEERFLRIFEYNDPKINLGAVLIDIAHGHSDTMLRQIARVQAAAPQLPIIAGNVATYEGAMDLLKAGACSIKCGVGPGSVCSTRIQTGNGVPQLTAIMECRRAIDDSGMPASLIADGGIRYGGDIVKALASGANAVMIGNLFAGTEEAIGEFISTRNGMVKVYRGMASREAQKSWKGYATSIEGEMMNVQYKGSAVAVLNGLVSGILSGMSYQDARNIRELQDNAVFIRQTSAGHRESQPYALLKE